MPMFWYVLAVLTFLGVIYKLPVIGKLFSQITAPVGGRKNAWIVLVLVGLWVGGVFAGLFTATAGTASTAAIAGLPVQIARMDLRSATSDAGCTVGEDSIRENLAFLRCTDAQANETAGIEDFQGEFLVTRKSSEKAGSLKVEATVTEFKSPSSTSDPNIYKIVEETSAGELEVYLKSGANATTSDSKELTYIDFAEGDSEITFGVTVEIDEEASDELNIYDTKNIVLNFADGFKYVIEYMDLDAAA